MRRSAAIPANAPAARTTQRPAASAKSCRGGRGPATPRGDLGGCLGRAAMQRCAATLVASAARRHAALRGDLGCLGRAATQRCAATWLPRPRRHGSLRGGRAKIPYRKDAPGCAPPECQRSPSAGHCPCSAQRRPRRTPGCTRHAALRRHCAIAPGRTCASALRGNPRDRLGWTCREECPAARTTRHGAAIVKTAAAGRAMQRPRRSRLDLPCDASRRSLGLSGWTRRCSAAIVRIARLDAAVLRGDFTDRPAGRATRRSAAVGKIVLGCTRPRGEPASRALATTGSSSRQPAGARPLRAASADPQPPGLPIRQLHARTGTLSGCDDRTQHLAGDCVAMPLPRHPITFGQRAPPRAAPFAASPRGPCPARLRDVRCVPGGKDPGASPSGGRTDPYAIGSFLRKGRLSQLLPAATMQLRPAGVVLTTVQVFLFSDA